MWDDDVIAVYLLEGPRYVRAAQSALLPGFDLSLAAELAPLPQREAVRELRRRLRGA